MADIRAIILAAGASRRMKANKLLLPYGGKTILECTLDNIIQSQLKDMIVVLGAYRDELKPVTDRYPVITCINRNYRKGMFSSVLCGMKALPAGTDAVIFYLGDQPMIPPSVTDRILEAYLRSGKGLIVPTFYGRRGHPLLVDKRYFKEIRLLKGPGGLRTLLEKHPQDVLEAGVMESTILRDIDTPEAYQKEITYK